MKQCTRCQAEKPLSEFYRASRKQRGKLYRYHQSRCKECVRAEVRQRAQAPEKRQAAREYARARDPGERQAVRRIAAQKAGKVYRTAEQIADEREAKRAMRGREKERRARERLDLVDREPWRSPNLSKAERFAMRYKMDAEFNLHQRVRAGLRRKRQGIRLDTVVRQAVSRDGRSPKAESFLGYSMSELRQHLERQFDRRMTWEAFNDGRIHIDHIRPLASFDVSNPDDLKCAWCITNLRPVWAADNLSKGARRERLI